MKNFHTHTYRCMHATGTDEEYVLAAIEAGYDVLGFADHSPWKYDSNFVAFMRMPLYEFDDYYKSLFHLKKKYQDKIDIKIGLECEYYPKYHDWLTKFVKETNLDYVILGNHYYESDEKNPYFGSCTKYDEMLDKYVESTIAGLETGLYAYLAHPDLYCRPRRWDKKCEEAAHKICAYCKEHDIIMEYNLAGLRYTKDLEDMKYPHEKFWEIAASYKNKAIIGVDAHSPKHLKDKSFYNFALEKLNDLGIEVVENIEFLNFEKK